MQVFRIRTGGGLFVDFLLLVVFLFGVDGVVSLAGKFTRRIRHVNPAVYAS